MKTCAVINDLSGFGKCSLGVALPIISVMGSEVHPLQTAALSNQTGYDGYSCASLTSSMPDFVACWKKHKAAFDCIFTGYVADEKQLDIIDGFIDYFKSEKTLLIVDPVMADDGNLYDGYTEKMCRKIKNLCLKADIITPNTAELAFLAGEPYTNDYEKIISYAEKLIRGGMKSIVVTGYKKNGTISNLVFEKGNMTIISAKEKGGYYSGTGDILASVIAGGVLRGMSLTAAVRLAADFIERSIAVTDDKAHCEGIDFEKLLEVLI